MIFSNFFKAKWQHKNKDVRIVAISEDLSADNDDDRQILMQMVTDDDSPLVRRAALNKLNSFHMWLSTSYDNTEAHIRDFANKQVISILHNKHDIKLSNDEKLQLIKNFGQHKSDKLSVLEEWMYIETDIDVIKSLFEKIAKPQLIQPLFSKKADVNLQKFLIEKITDNATLEKLLKKSTHDEITQLLKNKLADLAEKLEQPIKLRKNIQLLLAKFLALKDQTEYGLMIEKKSIIENDWDTAKKDFFCLAEAEQATFLEKFSTIEVQLEKIFAKKAEQYQQQQIAAKVLAEKQSITQRFDDELKTISHGITAAFIEQNEANENKCQEQLSALEKSVQSSTLDKEQKSSYFTIIKQHQGKLNRLPMIAEAVIEATRLIAQLSQLSLPTSQDELPEKESSYKSWRSQWRNIEKQAEGLLSPSLTEAYQLINKSWQDALQPLVKHQKSLLAQTQKKLSEFNRLINSGKYNPSFSVFKKAQHLFEQLDTAQQTKVQREFDKASEKISELNDWEHYIATPRKQQYLKDVQLLIESPLDNPNEQASKVKEFRLLWNSLGHADEEVDKDLNEAFNQACEDAFAPCRLYYAEQEKVREQNLKIRLTILENAQKLNALVSSSLNINKPDEAIKEVDKEKSNTSSPDIDWKYIDGQMNKLQQKWRDAGEVERSKYKTLHNDFNNLLQPIKQAIREFHQKNINEKNALIAKAEKEQANEDVYSAINNIKKLQTQWRNIGYAGPSQENKLWQKFRSINDDVFSKRSALVSAEKNQQTELQAKFEEKLIVIKKQLQDDMTLAILKRVNNDLHDLQTEILTNKPVIKVAINAVEQELANVDKQIKICLSSAEKKNWVNVFSVLEYIANNEETITDVNTIPLYLELVPFWQKKVAEQVANQTISNRDKATLALEILASIESPQELQQERLAVQVSLMQEQMQSGITIDLQAELLKWLKVGKIQSQDLSLLQRIKPIYC